MVDETWAVHSHTPISVVEWTAFQSKIEKASRTPEKVSVVDANMSESMSQLPVFLKQVTEEKHVIDNTETVLRAAFSGVSVDFQIEQNTKYTFRSPT